VASASFPLLFAPTDVPGVGPCIDGGAVNNTPIKYALGGAVGRQVDTIIVVSPTVAYLPVDAQHEPVVPRGLALAGRLAEMLVNERLYRDLHDHEERNAALTGLRALSPGVLDPGQLAAVIRALGWEDNRVVEVVQIRPLEPLPGSAFSGFASADLRARYIEIGIERARKVITDG
jgi:predicted acylesterase/phospholipase RssA